MWKAKRIAFLQQRVEFITPDEITDEINEYLDGWVRFEFDTLQYEVDNNNPRLDKDQERLVMTSYAEITVKRGDRIRIGEEVFNVAKVVEKVDSEHERFVVLNSRTKRFKYKEITLE